MIDERLLMKKVRKKVWNTFQSMWDEVDYLAILKRNDPGRFTRFLDEEFTREEGLRIEALIRGK
jgi:hypothetical protein